MAGASQRGRDASVTVAAARALPVWLAGEPGAWRLMLWVQPGAAHTATAGVQGGCLKLRVAARPVEGAANGALVAWVAERLRCTRREVSLVRGDHGRRKLLAVGVSLSAQELCERLGAGG